MESLRVHGPLDGVAELELLGPGKGNAMGPELWAELPGAVAALGADPDVRVILLRASGSSFCYGLDLAAMMTVIATTLGRDGGLAGARTDFLAVVERMQQAITALEECPRPVVAAVQGWCIGGGVDLVAAADIRLASADARFSVREVKVAIVADMGSLQRLPAIVGEGWTRRLALTGEDIDAALAERIGLVSEVLADPEALLARGRELSAAIAANPPLVVQGTKRVLNASRDLPRRDALAHVALWNAAFLPSHDLTEAVAAFAQRRPPEFQGR